MASKEELEAETKKYQTERADLQVRAFQTCLTESNYIVILQKSIPAKIRRLILYISNEEELEAETKQYQTERADLKVRASQTMGFTGVIFFSCSYRGTSLTRKRTTLGPYRRPMPRVLLGGSQGGPMGVGVFL